MKKGKKQAKPDGQSQGQPGNKAKHKRLAKTAAMNEFDTLTRANAVLNAEKEKISEVSKKIFEEKNKIAVEKQALIREQKPFARAKKALEKNVSRRE